MLPAPGAVPSPAGQSPAVGRAGPASASAAGVRITASSARRRLRVVAGSGLGTLFPLHDSQK